MRFEVLGKFKTLAVLEVFLLVHAVNSLEATLGQRRGCDGPGELRLAVGAGQVRAVAFHGLAHDAGARQRTVGPHVVVQRVQGLLFGALRQGVGDRVLLTLGGSGAYVLERDDPQFGIGIVEPREEPGHLLVEGRQAVAFAQVAEAAGVLRGILAAVALKNQGGRQGLGGFRGAGILKVHTHHDRAHAGAQNPYARKVAAAGLLQALHPGQHAREVAAHRGGVCARLGRHGGVEGDGLLDEGIIGRAGLGARGALGLGGDLLRV